MQLLPWRRKKLEASLSEYIDGELDSGDLTEIGEQVVLNSRSRHLLDSLQNVNSLVVQAVAPVGAPELNEVTARLSMRLEREPETPDAAVAPRRWGAASTIAAPVGLASVGLLITGVAIARLRRRGIV